MKKYLSIIIGLFITGFVACKEEEFELGDPPSSADASFTYTTSSESDNIINFKAANSQVIAVWDFGNSTSGKGTNVTASYPRKGTYMVTLTIFNQGGSITTSQEIVIVNDDFSLLNDPLFTMLTGGVDSTGGKTWVIDSASVGHFGVGPNPIDPTFGDTSNFYSAGINEKVGAGLYNDRYVFKIEGFNFDMITKGEIYLNAKQEPVFPGSYDPGVGDLTAPFPDQLGQSWLLKFDAGQDTTLTVSGNSFLGYNTGVSTYKVIRLTENSIYLSYEDINDPALLWYIRLIPEGYAPSGGGGSNPTFTMPFDFETEEPTFIPFGNSTVAVIDNHDPRGINTSGRVLETVHGNEVWAGISVDLSSKLDFSTDSSISVKIWAPTVGTLRMKIEDKADPDNTFKELDIAVPVANTWIERKINFGRVAANNTYDRLVLFPGWDVANAGTFYLDDIQQK